MCKMDENLSDYIYELKKDAETAEKIAPLLQHIAFLEAELRFAKGKITTLKIKAEDPEKVSFNKPKRERDLTLAERELYRAVGELAFVIAKADKILRESEKEAFRKVIREDLGVSGWIAEDRFNMIEHTPTSDLDSSYNHVIFLIKKNSAGLTEDLKNRFIHVITKVAEVAGVHHSQKALINRFKEDITKICNP